MADLLTLNAVNKIKESLNTLNLKLSSDFERPVHAANVIQVTSSCCVCIPATASKYVLEMWGQGGGGAGALCCQWGKYGGQGGSYAHKTVDLSSCNCYQTLCACAYNNATRCCFTGSPGCYSYVKNCTTSSIYCVNGGTGGASVCFFCCGLTCNGQWATAYNNLGIFTISQLSEETASVTTYPLCSFAGIDKIDRLFQKATCNCFDEYRLGSCGFSGTGITQLNDDYGHGGAAYAGGAVQVKTYSAGNSAYCGECGNFPGGGGQGSGACGGGSCCGSVGGAGLIIISWE